MKTNKVSKFNVENFEILETKGEVLKGGFSNVYTGHLGGIKDATNYYKCTIVSNNVAGCGGTSEPTKID